MDYRCVGADCSARFKDKHMSSKMARNVMSKSNQWLCPLLQSDGVDILKLTDSARLCQKCYSKYNRMRSKDEPSVSTDSLGTEVETSVQANEHISDVSNPSSVPMGLTGADSARYSSSTQCTNTCESDGVGEQAIQNDNGCEDKPCVRGFNKFPPVTLADLFYGPASHRKCSICFKYSDSGLTKLPQRAKCQLIFTQKLWCPNNSRVCEDHLIGDDLHPDVKLDKATMTQLKELLSERAEEIINDLLFINQSSIQLPCMDFTLLSDSECKTWTGWTLSQLQIIHDSCKDAINTPPSVSTETAMVLFWAKLRTNISFEQLSALSGVSDSTASRIFNVVLSAIKKGLVKDYIGVNQMTREEALTHNTAFTKCFYGNKVTLILDGTYIYIPKSSDHKMQRSSYSGQKKRNLLKFMSIVFPDGYVLDTIGPFFGNFNDAKITRVIFEKVTEIKAWLHETDIFIVDRGFRDVLDLLSSSGYETHMPSFRQPGQTQHETYVANEDRLCTKTRWVVESYHGRLKHWRMFKDQLSSNYLVPVIGDLVQIVTACLNAIRGPIYKQSQEQIEGDQLLAERMKSRLNQVSPLAKRVEQDPNLSKRCKAEWQKIDGASIEFPRLGLGYLQTLTCGTYQLKMAPGYISDHQKVDGDYEISVYQHSADLLRGQLESRHQSKTAYKVWIQFDKDDTNDPIKDYYCVCPAGKRTVGMCAHTASILFYLGHMANQASACPQPQTKKFKSAFFSDK